MKTELKKYKLKDLLKIKNGQDHKGLHDGCYPVYGGNGLRGFSCDYTHDGTYILIGRQGALCGNINYVEGKNYISEHAIAVQSRENMLWLKYKLEYWNLFVFLMHRVE